MHRGRCCWAYLLPVLHYHYEIWAAYVEAEVAKAPWETPYGTLPWESSGLWMSSVDCPMLLPCAGLKMVRTTGAQNSLRIRPWHDNKLDDDTALGAFEKGSWHCLREDNLTLPTVLHVPPLRSPRLHPPICEA